MDIGEKVDWLDKNGLLSVKPKTNGRKYAWVKWGPSYSIKSWAMSGDSVDEAILKLWDKMMGMLFVLCQKDNGSS